MRPILFQDNSPHVSADLGPLPDGGVGLQLLGGEDPLLGVEVDAGDRGQGEVRVGHLQIGRTVVEWWVFKDSAIPKCLMGSVVLHFR